MSKRSNYIISRMLCLTLAVAMVFTMMPMSAGQAFAAESTKPDTKVSEGKALFDLEKTAPSELNSYPDNVYDVDKGEAFLLSEQNELALLVTDNGNKTMYRMDDLNMAQTLMQSEDLRWVDGVNVSNTRNTYMPATKLELYSDLIHAQSVGFDSDGTGRREYIATVGYDTTQSQIKVIIQNAETGSGRAYTLDDWKATWMSGQGLWLMDNYFAITAGDYDNDGQESVIVYVCGDGANVKLYEYYPSDTNAWKRRTILSLDSVVKNTAYKTSGDIKFKPAVGLATGDFDGDGRDQLAFTAGFYNTSGSVSDGYQDYACDNLEQFATTLGIMDYGDKGWVNSYSASLYDKSDKHVSMDTNKNKTYALTIMHGGMITAGDVNNDGMDEIVCAGYSSLTREDSSDGFARAIYNNKGNLTKVSGICNWSDDLVSSVIYRVEASKEYKRTNLASFKMPEFIRYNYAKYCREVDHVFARLAIAAGNTNGNSSNADVFISGVLYDFSGFSPEVQYAPNFSAQEMNKITGGSGKTSSVNWIKNVAAANFDQNDAGREQFIFTLWGKESGSANYSSNVGVITGVEFDDKLQDGSEAGYGSKDVASFGAPDGYACNLNVTDMTKANYPISSDGSDCKGYTQALARASASKCINVVPVAVDIDNDGLMGRFNSKGYVYTDPELLAVLEAGPYYEELDDLGGYSDPCETSFSVSTGYGTGTSTGDSVSFEAGVALEASGPCIKTSLEMGYAMDWSHTYEKNYKVTKRKTFAAQEYDTVVLSRVPVLVYTYDLFKVTNEETGEGKWVENGYNVRVPLTPRYFMLSIDEYNRFVTKYNKMIGDADNKLIQIEEGTDLPEGHEGVPDNYWRNLAQAGQGAALVSDDIFTLSYGSGNSSTEREDEEETTVSEEMSHGFHYSLTMQGGGDLVVGEAWAGGYVNLDYSHSKGTSKTTVHSKGTAGQVQNLNKAKLMSDAGMTDEQVESYKFTWQFIKWTRVLVEDGTEVPFYGYIVYDNSRPQGRPSLSGRSRTKVTEGYKTTEIDVNVSGKPAPEVKIVKGDSKFSLEAPAEGSTYKLVVAPGLPVGTHKVIVRADNKYGAAEFTFSVIVEKTADQQKAEKVSRKIRNLELYDLDIRVEFDDAEDYLKVLEAYNALTDAQKAYLTAADISKMEAAMELAEIGENRKNVRDDVYGTMERLDSARYFAENSYFITEDGLNELKENPEARENYRNYDYSYSVSTMSEAYNAIFDANEYVIDILLRENDLLGWIDTLNDINEKISKAYRYSYEIYDEEAADNLYDQIEARGFDEEIDALSWRNDKTWADISSFWKNYLEIRGHYNVEDGSTYSEAFKMSLLKSIGSLYDMLRRGVEEGIYRTSASPDQLCAQGDAADQAIDVANMIDDLPKYDEVKPSDEGTIDQAREAYDNLSEEQKTMIGDRYEEMLKTAEDCVAAAIKALPDIKKVAKVKGISASYVYSGKYKKPVPTLTVGAKSIKKGTDYTVSYKNNKYVGKATVTIKGIGNYRGTITKTFKIIPKATSITKVTAAKKGFTVKWSKRTTQTTGYQIQYGLKKSFKGAKTVTITKTKTTSKKITKLKAKKTYYVRVRTYKKVGSTKYYSKWSKYKAVKTKA